MTKSSKALTNPAELLKRNIEQANKRIAQSDSSRVKTAVTGFTVPGGQEGKELDVVVLDHIIVHSFWKGAYDPDNIKDPDCFASNRIFADLIPEENSPDVQADSCAVCPQNQWNSGPKGKGKACKNMRLLAVVPTSDVENGPIYTVSVSPTAVKRWDGYVRELASNNLAPMFVQTKISIAPGLTYASLVFDLLNSLSEGQVNAAIGRLEEAQNLLERKPQWEDK